jgi:hypothetical protein
MAIIYGFSDSVRGFERSAIAVVPQPFCRRQVLRLPIMLAFTFFVMAVQICDRASLWRAGQWTWPQRLHYRQAALTACPPFVAQEPLIRHRPSQRQLASRRLCSDVRTFRTTSFSRCDDCRARLRVE